MENYWPIQIQPWFSKSWVFKDQFDCIMDTQLESVDAEQSD